MDAVLRSLSLVAAGHPVSESLEEEVKTAFVQLQTLIAGKKTLLIINTLHCGGFYLAQF
jgi:hypothetical protein